MAAPKDLPQDIGTFIRDLRQTAKISLRQLADRAGVSNPYLSQIERGLRKPSAEVLQQIASALRVSTPAMYLRAGLLDSDGQPGVLAAIAADAELTMGQKQSLSQIYETFRNENVRSRPEAPDDDAESGPATSGGVDESHPGSDGSINESRPTPDGSINESSADALSGLVNESRSGGAGNESPRPPGGAGNESPRPPGGAGNESRPDTSDGV